MRRVVITGLGMVSPLACGVEETWARLVGGQSGADMWRILQEFLGNPGADPAAIARKLEAAAVKDYGSRR